MSVISIEAIVAIVKTFNTWEGGEDELMLREGMPSKFVRNWYPIQASSLLRFFIESWIFCMKIDMETALDLSSSVWTRKVEANVSIK